MNLKTSSQYIHGSAPVEQARLSVLNALINKSSIEQMRPRPGEKFLDVGSGLGQFARMIARATGERVVGIERDPSQIAECRRLADEEREAELLEVRSGDVHALPLSADEWGRFDAAHARFILEHVSDPETVVGNMVRAVKKGGRVILEDDDHDLLRLWPDPPGAREVWSAYCRSFQVVGNDPWIGRKLATMLHASGALPQRANWIFFGACSGEPEFPTYVDNLVGILNGARDHIISEGLLPPGGFDSGVRAILEWKKKPDATLWYARAWVEGRKP